jgi:hypothetical protein
MIPKKVKGSPNPFEGKGKGQVGPETKDSKEKETSAKQKGDVTPKDKKEEKKIPTPRVKRHRRKSKIPEPTTFLVLQKGKLQAVNVRLTVRAIKPKEVGGVERNLISMWNRNKDLFTE